MAISSPTGFVQGHQKIVLMKINLWSEQNVNDLVNCIHDKWFWKKDMSFDEDLKIFCIKFEEKKGESVLKIFHVNNVEIIDEANIGRYDFNEIDFDPISQRISITSGFPFRINLTVNSFEVEVERGGGPSFGYSF